MFNNFTFPNNHILTLIRIQFQFCLAEPKFNRSQNIIKHPLTEGRIEYKIKNGIICVEMLFFLVLSAYLQAACNKKKSKGPRTEPCGITSTEIHL